MTIRTLMHTLSIAMTFTRTKPSPAVAATFTGASPQTLYRRARSAPLEMRWKITAHGPVFRWEASRSASQTEAAAEPAPEAWSSLAVAV